MGRILEAVTGGGYNVLLVGDRGSGKTSLLAQTARRLRESHWDTAAVSGRLATDAREFLSLVRYSLDRARGERVGQSGAADSRAELAPPREGPTQEGEALLELVDGIRQAMNGRPDTAVLVDELPSASVAHTVFGRLRDEMWALPLSWVVTAQDTERPLYLRPPTDAFFEVVVDLEPLGSSEAVELLRRRLDPGDSTPVDELGRAGAGNPRRTLALARQVLAEGVSLDEAVRSENERGERFASLSSSAQRLVGELQANGPASASDEGLLRRLGWTRGRTSQVLAELEREHMVESTVEPSGHGRPRKVYELTDVTAL